MQHDSRFPVLHKSFYLLIPFPKNCCLKSAEIRCIIYVKLRICKCWFMAWHWLEKPRWFSIIKNNGFVLYIVPCLALNALRRAPCHCCIVVAKEWDCFNQGTYAWRELKELRGTKGTQGHELTRKACEDTVQRKLSIVVAAKRKVVASEWVFIWLMAEPFLNCLCDVILGSDCEGMQLYIPLKEL